MRRRLTALCVAATVAALVGADAVPEEAVAELAARVLELETAACDLRAQVLRLTADSRVPPNVTTTSRRRDDGDVVLRRPPSRRRRQQRRLDDHDQDADDDDEIRRFWTEVCATVDTLWLVVASILCLFLQAGFGLLETGAVRAKNARATFLKNLLDACVAGLTYYACGWALARGGGDSNTFAGDGGGYLLLPASRYDTTLGSGASAPSGLGGLSSAPEEDTNLGGGGGGYALFLFQWVFAATTATVVSGAVAERIRFDAYLVYVGVLSGVIYPLASHWIWHPDGFLYRGGVIDLAGGGVVHALAGAAAFVGAAACGPREDFDPKDLDGVALNGGTAAARDRKRGSSRRSTLLSFGAPSHAAAPQLSRDDDTFVDAAGPPSRYRRHPGQRQQQQHPVGWWWSNPGSTDPVGSPPGPLRGHDAPMMAFGGLLLWCGFLPFNAASLGAICGAAGVVARIAVVTTLAACAGGVTSLLVGLRRERHFSIEYATQGVLAGMVGVASCAAVVEVWAAVFVVAPLAVLCSWALDALAKRHWIDDPLRASAVHWGSGAVSLVVGVGVFASPKLVADVYLNGYDTARDRCASLDGLVKNDDDSDRVDYAHRARTSGCRDFYGVAHGGSGRQLAWQVAALGCYTAWALATSAVVFVGLRAAGLLRVKLEDEVRGLDVTHHGGDAYAWDRRNTTPFHNSQQQHLTTTTAGPQHHRGRLLYLGGPPHIVGGGRRPHASHVAPGGGGRNFAPPPRTRSFDAAALAVGGAASATGVSHHLPQIDEEEKERSNTDTPVVRPLEEDQPADDARSDSDVGLDLSRSGSGGPSGLSEPASVVGV